MEKIFSVNCVWGAWSGWGQCSKTCGTGGKETRTRSKTVVEANGGTCSGESTRTKSCQLQECIPLEYPDEEGSGEAILPDPTTPVPRVKPGNMV